jgi:SAM-dependent methyltransferase
MTIIAPTLEGFDEVLNLIAGDPRITPDSPVWIRETLQSAGDKLRILRFMHQVNDAVPLRVLDVGAQIGAFALYAARVGHQVSAVDYPFYAARYGKIAAEHGVDYRECDLGYQRLPFDDAVFDLVVYTDVIEHHSFSPKKVLMDSHRVLRPGGLILVTTPNHASIYNRLLLFAGRSVNDGFESYFDAAANLPIYPGHHREYTRRELRLALEKTGFVVRECRIVEEELGAFFYFLRSRPGWRAEMLRHWQTIVIRGLGEIWRTLHIPFGRVIWAVGQKLPR